MHNQAIYLEAKTILYAHRWEGLVGFRSKRGSSVQNHYFDTSPAKKVTLTVT